VIVDLFSLIGGDHGYKRSALVVIHLKVQLGVNLCWNGQESDTKCSKGWFGGVV
jgi:hypothetical protein